LSQRKCYKPVSLGYGQLLFQLKFKLHPFVHKIVVAQNRRTGEIKPADKKCNSTSSGFFYYKKFSSLYDLLPAGADWLCRPAWLSRQSGPSAVA